MREIERKVGMESTGSGQPDEAQQQLMIGRQLAFDFYDPSLEWRRLFAETWGTFLLVLVAAGGGVVAAMSGGRVTLGMMVVAPGIMVMAIIYFMGAVSGAHLNPAVTLAFALRRDFPWKRVPSYIAGASDRRHQCGGVSSVHVWDDWRTRRDATRRWCERRESACDGSGSDGWAGEYNPGNGVRCAEHRHERRHRRGRIHCSGGALGSVGKRGLYESGAFAGAGCGAWQLPHDLDLRRRTLGGRPDRSGVRVDSQREGVVRRQDRGAWHAWRRQPGHARYGCRAPTEVVAY